MNKRANDVYKQSLKEQVSKYLLHHKTLMSNAIDIAHSNNVIESSIVESFSHLSIMHSAMCQHDIIDSKFDDTIQNALQYEIWLCDKFAPETFDKLDAAIEAIVQLYNLTEQKHKLHDELAQFICKICKATGKPAVNDTISTLKDKYSVIVADNRIWVQFFGSHTVELYFDDLDNLSCKIENKTRSNFTYTNKNNAFDFRTYDFDSMSFSYAIINALLNNSSFQNIILNWRNQCKMIDIQRYELKPLLRALICMYDNVIVTKVCNGCLFEARYDTTAGASTLHEIMYNNVDKDVVIGNLKHKLWGKRNYDALIDWMFNCEYTTRSIDNAWLAWLNR